MWLVEAVLRLTCVCIGVGVEFSYVAELEPRAVLPPCRALCSAFLHTPNQLHVTAFVASKHNVATTHTRTHKHTHLDPCNSSACLAATCRTRLALPASHGYSQLASRVDGISTAGWHMTDSNCLLVCCQLHLIAPTRLCHVP